MDIPEGTTKEILEKVKERLGLNEPTAGTHVAGKQRRRKKPAADWKHGKFIRLLIKCDHRTPKPYWKAFCEMVVARIVDNQWDFSASHFPFLNDKLLEILHTHRRGRNSRQWHCRAVWEKNSNPNEEEDHANDPSNEPAVWITEFQIDHPPEELVEAICKMNIPRSQLIDAAVPFCRFAHSYSSYLRKEKASKGATARKLPKSENPAQSSRRNCSDSLKRRVLEKMNSIKNLPAASIRTVSEEIEVAPSTLRNCLAILCEEGLLKRLKDLDTQGANRHMITPKGKSWLKTKSQ